MCYQAHLRVKFIKNHLLVSPNEGTKSENDFVFEVNT